MRIHVIQTGIVAIKQVQREGDRLYEQTFRNFMKITVAREKAGSPPEVVAQAVLKALTVATPKTRYPVGANARILTLMAQFMPVRRLDKIRFKIFELPQKFGIWAGADQSKMAPKALDAPGMRL